MDITELLENLDMDAKDKATSNFLNQFLRPAFGALPKAEIELLVLEFIRDINGVSSSPSVYELVSTLRVTRLKARKLIYDRELRRRTRADLDLLVKEILKRPILQKSGKQFVLEVENPLVLDHLRAKVQTLGFVSDGSFSPSIVKLPVNAMIAVVTSYFTKEDLEGVKETLIRAGAPDGSLSGVLKKMFQKLASKVADDAGEAVMEKASEYITPLLDVSLDVLFEKAGEIFAAADEEQVEEEDR